MGSGTTGKAALRLSRKFIGIEIDKTHFDNARAEISKLILTSQNIDVNVNDDGQSQNLN
jgi:DNA modification methylase